MTGGVEASRRLGTAGRTDSSAQRPMTRFRVDPILNLLLVLAAFVVAGTTVYRTLASRRPAESSAAPRGYYPRWRELLPLATTRGSTVAPVTFVVLSDLQCPYCAQLHRSLSQIDSISPSTIRYAFIHFPVASHAMSVSAAAGANCAGVQGQFFPFVDLVFRNMRALPRTSVLADSLPSLDPGRFRSCLSAADTSALVRARDQLAVSLSVRGTPTVYINGWRVNGALADTTLRRVVQDIISRRRPFDDFPVSELPPEGE